MNYVKRLDEEILNFLIKRRRKRSFKLKLFSEKWWNIWSNCGNRGKINREKETPINADSSENISNDAEQIKCKFPKLVIKEFNRNILNWQTFSDQFESKIHSKININNIDKFSYSKSFLCPWAYETVSGLALTNQNYLEAVKLLKQRYGNPQLFINTYMEQFVKLEK